MDDLEQIKEKVLEGYELTKEEAIHLASYKQELLSQHAHEIREKLCGEGFDMCSIINGKSGACSENCKFCAQSGHYHTGVETYSMISKEKAYAEAESNAQEGVLRYSIVTSGKRLSKKEVKEVSKIYKYIAQKCNIHLCASHGLVDEEDCAVLVEAGVSRYHNNLETSKSYFSQICTTHTYEDKVKTIEAAKGAGMSVCSGGLWGMGETLADRIDMIFELKALGIVSIPINVLVAIEGTPFESLTPITEEEVLKTLAIYRFVHPKATLRLAGGRSKLSEAGKKAFLGGANGAISGNMLTTCGNTIQQDLKLLESCGFEVKCCE